MDSWAQVSRDDGSRKTPLGAGWFGALEPFQKLRPPGLF
jgi:hypothetical protein